MAIPKLRKIEEGELVDPEDLQNLLGVSESTEGLSFNVEGSFIDHMINEYPKILTFDVTADGVNYHFDIDWPSEFPDDNKAEERNHVRDAFLRSGIAEHRNINEVMAELRNQDDVVLGVDGNILRDCTITSTLLDKIYEETYPNWILVGIPRLVMSGMESAAKQEFTDGSHPRVGWPTYRGRIGQRALQEVMDLRKKNPDRPGLAMMTIGELQHEAKELQSEDWKIDALIRDQFKQFLDNIGFHKGTFFLSQNRVNVMMSGTEGGDALYLEKPGFNELKEGSDEISAFTMLIYELCLQFGSIRISPQDDTELMLELNAYWPGKQVADWEHSRLSVGIAQ